MRADTGHKLFNPALSLLKSARLPYGSTVVARRQKSYCFSLRKPEGEWERGKEGEATPSAKLPLGLAVYLGKPSIRELGCNNSAANT